MPAVNVILLVGNLTRDPEVHYSPTGTPVATLGLAVNTRVRGQDGQWREDPCFVDVVVFGPQAEACGEYLEKGAPALVEGRLQYRTWQDQEGHTRRTHEVIAVRVQFLPRTRPHADAVERGVPADVEADGDDEVPC
jgi:single-strand DNA-binding protein